MENPAGSADFLLCHGKCKVRVLGQETVAWDLGPGGMQGAEPPTVG